MNNLLSILTKNKVHICLLIKKSHLKPVCSFCFVLCDRITKLLFMDGQIFHSSLITFHCSLKIHYPTHGVIEWNTTTVKYCL